jgi:hypothetical protein
VSLGRPVAVTASSPTAASSITDPQVAPASFSPAVLNTPLPMVRGQIPDTPQPLPPGPQLDTETAPPPKAKQEKKADTGAPKAKPGPHPLTEEAPPALEPEPRVISPVPLRAPHFVSSPPIVSSSDGACDGSDVCCEDGPACRFPWLRWWTPLWHCNDCDHDQSCFYARGEYLLWWTKHSDIPPLVTTSPPGTPVAQAGVLGADGTQVLFGGQVDPEERSGARLTLGWWFDQEHTIGIEGSGFFLGERTTRFAASSAGDAILARPFYDVTAGMEASELVSYTGIVPIPDIFLHGGVAVNSVSRLYGGDLDLRFNFARGCCWRLDWLAGFRYLALDESLNIGENLVALNPDGTFAQGIILADNFGTQNNFYGGQLGADFEICRGHWSLDLLAKVALGDVNEVVNISGGTVSTFPNGSMTSAQGGLLALPTNIGHYSRDRFAIVPEAGLRVGWQATEHIRLTVGYSFLYIDEVVRPGNQIDRGVNVSQLPSPFGPGALVGPARPAFAFHSSDYWAQGVSFGLEFRY